MSDAAEGEPGPKQAAGPANAGDSLCGFGVATPNGARSCPKRNEIQPAPCPAHIKKAPAGALSLMLPGGII